MLSVSIISQCGAWRGLFTWCYTEEQQKQRMEPSVMNVPRAGHMVDAGIESNVTVESQR